MHNDEPCPIPRRQGGKQRIREARYIVDGVDPLPERKLSNNGIARIYSDQYIPRGTSCVFKYGRDARNLLRRGYATGTWSAGLTADVDNGRALVDKGVEVLDGRSTPPMISVIK